MPPDPAASIKILEKKIADLQKEIADLEKRVATLEGSNKDAWSNIVPKGVFDTVQRKVKDLETNQGEIWKKLGM